MFDKESYIIKAKEIYGDKYDLSNIPSYFNSTEEINVICPKHGKFKRKAYLFISGKHHCSRCQNENRKITTDEFIKRSKIRHGDKYDYSKVDYKGGLNEVEIVCPKHGSFLQAPYIHISGSGCPLCHESTGERYVSLILKEMSINFIRGKKFEDCKSELGRQLPFDFYLPDYNLCIEYDGKQHYEPINIFGGDYSYKRQVHLDSIKNKYCEDNNIKLLRIKYTISGYNKISKLLIEYFKTIKPNKMKYIVEYKVFIN